MSHSLVCDSVVSHSLSHKQTYSLQGTEGELASGEPNGKCWGGYYCPARSTKPDMLQTEPGKSTVVLIRLKIKKLHLQQN